MERPNDIPTDGSCVSGHPCLGLLAPGSYHTAVFTSPFAFDIAESGGWQNREDVAWTFPLLPIDHPGDSLTFFRGPRASEDFATILDSVPADVPSIAAWFTANPALTVSAPVDVTIGGLPGTWFDVAIAPDAENGDPACPVRVCQSMLVGKADAGPPWGWGLAGEEKQRVYLLTGPTGTIAIIADSVDGTSFDDLTTRASAILETVKFD